MLLRDESPWVASPFFQPSDRMSKPLISPHPLKWSIRGTKTKRETNSFVFRSLMWNLNPECVQETMKITLDSFIFAHATSTKTSLRPKCFRISWLWWSWAESVTSSDILRRVDWFEHANWARISRSYQPVYLTVCCRNQEFINCNQCDLDLTGMGMLDIFWQILFSVVSSSKNMLKCLRSGRFTSKIW